MSYKLNSVLNYGIESTLDVLNEGFSDYIVPIHLDKPAFFKMLRVDSIDVSLSQVIFGNDIAIGAALVARRGWQCRLAGMAILPEARDHGGGRWLMDQLISQAKARGDRRMELEVIVGNDPAIALYERVGFKKFRSLVSYQGHNLKGAETNLEFVDIFKAAHMVALYGESKLPWQLSSHTLAHYGPPNLAIHRENAWLVISSPKLDPIHIRSIVVHPDFRQQDRAKRLLQGVFASYPNKKWYLPAIFPEEIEGLFKRLGFRKEPISQFQMELELN